MKKLSKVEIKALLNQGAAAVAVAIVSYFESITSSAFMIGQLLIAAREEWGDNWDTKNIKPTQATKAMIDSCIRVANGEIDERLVLVPDNDKYRLVARYPKSEQKKILDKGVQLVILKDGDVDTLNTPLHALTCDQTTQVLAPEGVRDVPSQRAWLFDQQKKNAAKAEREALKLDVVIIDEGKGKKHPPTKTTKIVEPANTQEQPDWEIVDGGLKTHAPDLFFDELALHDILRKIAKERSKGA